MKVIESTVYVQVSVIQYVRTRKRKDEKNEEHIRERIYTHMYIIVHI